MASRISNVRLALLAPALFLVTSGAQAIVNETKLLDSAGDAADHLGWSVAIDGNYAIVGAPIDNTMGNNAGKAVIYFFNGSTWIEQATLYPSVNPAEGKFGLSVDISGDRAVVGAPYPHQNGIDTGRVYTYSRTLMTWSLDATFSGADSQIDDNYGDAVAIDGDQLFVGAPGFTHVQLDSGAVYTYQHLGGTWSFVGKIQNPAGPTTSGFGTDVSVWNGGATNWGAISAAGRYGELPTVTAVHDASGSWAYDQTFTGWDTATKSDQFGRGVSIDGTHILTGANAHGHGSSQGAGYVLDRTSSWMHEKELLEPGGTGGYDNLGGDADLWGDTAILGAQSGDGIATDSGIAYVYRHHPPSSWVEVAALSAGDGYTGQNFGKAVGVSGNCVIVGASSDSQNGQFAGAAYIYCGIPQIPYLVDFNIICCVQIPDYTTGPVEFEIRFENLSDVTQFVQHRVELLRPDGGIVEVLALQEAQVEIGASHSEVVETMILASDPVGTYSLVLHYEGEEGFHTEMMTFQVVAQVPALPLSGLLTLAGSLAGLGVARLRVPFRR